MSIKVDSTTDTPEAVLAATGSKAEVRPEEDTDESAPTEESESGESSKEQEEDSDTSKEEESEESDDSDDDEDSDEEDEDGKEEKSKKSKKGRGGFKRRIDKLSKQRAEALQQAEYWREQALRGQKPDQGQESKEEPAKQQASDKPDPDKFDSHEEYLDALTDWKVEQRLSAREQKDRETQLKSEQAKQEDAFRERAQEFAKAHDDFQEVLEDVGHIPMSIAVQEAFLTSDNGPELFYEMAKDPAEYQRINALSPLAAAREIGKLETRLSKSESQEAKPTLKTTKAPKPPAPIGGKSASAVTKDPEKMSFQEFKKWREGQR